MLTLLPKNRLKTYFNLIILMCYCIIAKAGEINLNQEILESRASIQANAGTILAEQGRYLVDIQYRTSPLTVNISGEGLPDDLDQSILEEDIKNFLRTLPKANLVTWPKFNVDGYTVIVNSASPFSIMDQVVPVRENLLGSLLTDTYFIYTAFSSNFSEFKSVEIFGGFSEEDRVELESRIKEIIYAKPGKNLLYYLNRISNIRRLSSGKFIRNLAGYKLNGSPKGFISSKGQEPISFKVLQAIRNFLEHGTRDVKITTWNFDENITEDQPVVRNFRTLSYHTLRLFLKDNHGSISTTPNHPFFVLGKGWIKAIDLKSGDILVGKDSRIEVAGSKLEKFAKPMYLYNLEVAKYNNYFVVSPKTKKHMLVHNCNEEDFDDYDEDEYIAIPQDINPDHRDHSDDLGHVCFTGDTQIRQKYGAKSIKLVEVGDEVLSCNDKTNTCEYKAVEKIYRTSTKQLVHVKAEGMAKAIRSTPNHPYFIAELNRYVKADSLKVGQHLVYQDPVTKQNSLDKIESIEKENLSRKIPVYNFGVHKNENYYVAASNDFGDDIFHKRFYKVHNCSVGLDFVPIVGGAKGIGEALYGKDLITQEDLAWWERCIAAGTVVPFAGPSVKKISKAMKAASKEEKVLKYFAKLEKDAEKVIAADAKLAQQANVGGFKGPAAKKWDWDHIIDGHASWGKKAKHRGKDHQIFHGMTESQIKAHTKSAWKNRKNIGTQTDVTGVTRVRYRGTNPDNGKSVEFFYNTKTKTVETAFPVE